MMNFEVDFHAWLVDQAAVLRARDYEAVDCEALAEEIEAMARAERREVMSRLVTLLMHLLKLKFEPQEIRRHHGWRSTVIEARRQIRLILNDSPSILQGRREQVMAEAYQAAREDAASESGLPLGIFPEHCPWTYEQIMD